MRIISQDGMVDLPFEQCGIYVFFDEVFSENYKIQAYLSQTKTFKVAEYSTKEKAEKAMESLRNIYEMEAIERVYADREHDYHPCFQFPREDELEE